MQMEKGAMYFSIEKCTKLIAIFITNLSYINLSISFLEKTLNGLPDLKAGRFSSVKPMPLLQQHFHPDLAVF